VPASRESQFDAIANGICAAFDKNLHRPHSRNRRLSWQDHRPSYTRKGPAVNKNSALTAQNEALKFVGLDVHKETIAIAVADSGRAAPRALGVIRNDLDELR
jgi:hypothetical protein